MSAHIVHPAHQIRPLSDAGSVSLRIRPFPIGYGEGSTHIGHRAAAGPAAEDAVTDDAAWAEHGNARAQVSARDDDARDVADAEAARRVQAALAAEEIACRIAQRCRALEAEAAHHVAAVAEDMIAIALAVGRKLAGAAVAAEPFAGAEHALRAAVKTRRVPADLTLHLPPDIAAAFSQRPNAQDDPAIRVVPDATLNVGDFVLDLGCGSVERRFAVLSHAVDTAVRASLSGFNPSTAFGSAATGAMESDIS